MIDEDNLEELRIIYLKSLKIPHKDFFKHLKDKYKNPELSQIQEIKIKIELREKIEKSNLVYQEKPYSKKDFEKMRRYSPRTLDDKKILDEIEDPETRSCCADLIDARNFFTQTKEGIEKVCNEFKKS